jgi:alkylated DNA nucleotide flippase Atl1
VGLSKAFLFGGENRQRELLEAEGVRFAHGKVDMGRGDWLRYILTTK